MQTIIVFIDIIFLIPSMFFASYLACLTLLAMSRRPKLLPIPKTLRRFAVMVPAHNEEAVIEKTLHSLKQIYYPSNKFEIVVIADNCNDKTRNYRQKMNVMVLERFDSINVGKGYALRWCMDQLIDSECLIRCVRSYRCGHRCFDKFIIRDEPPSRKWCGVHTMQRHGCTSARLMEPGDDTRRIHSPQLCETIGENGYRLQRRTERKWHVLFKEIDRE